MTIPWSPAWPVTRSPGNNSILHHPSATIGHGVLKNRTLSLFQTMGLSEIHPLKLKWVDNNFVGATKTKSIFADELRFPISVISSMFVTMEWDITAWFVTQCQIFVIYWILSSSPSRHKITPRDCPWSLAPGEYQRWIECCLLPPPLSFWHQEPGIAATIWRWH